MNKKIFGVRLGSILTFILCLLCAFAVWVYIKITSLSALDAASAALSYLFLG